MGVVVRSPANKKIERADCKCFILARHKNDETNFLCFRENIVGALTDEQEKKLCTERSFIPEGKTTPTGLQGLAKDNQSEEVRNILRTIQRFSKGVHAATKVYDESGKKDIPYWRAVVREEVNKQPQLALEPPPEKKSQEKKREKPVGSGRAVPPPAKTTDETLIEGRDVKTPEDIKRERAAWEARYMKKKPSPKPEDRETWEERMLVKAERLNYRYNPETERVFFPFGVD